MTKEFICRLCGNDYSDEFFEIYDDDGNPNEGYRITANFFNSRFLDLQNGNHLKSLCSDCWNHIYEFHKFQGFVFQMETNVMAKLQEIKETTNNRNEEDFSDASKLTEHSTESKTNGPEKCIVKLENKIPCEFESYEISDDSEEEEHAEQQMKQSLHSGRLFEDDYDISYSELEELDTQLNSESETDKTHESTPANAENTKSPENNRLGNNDDNDVDYNPRREFTKRRRRKRIRMDNFATLPQDNSYRSQQNPIFLKFVESNQRTAKDADDLIAQWLPTLQCVECENKYTSFTLLKDHFQEAHRNKRFYVVCCQRNFIYRCYLAEHVCLHFDPYVFRCKKCGRVFTNRANLCAHKANQCVPLEPTRERKTYKELDDNIAKWKPKLECVVCKESYDTFTILKQHFELKHPNDKFYTVCCRNRFSTRYRMEEHIQTHLKRQD
ncbi:transcription factor grauzone [Musca domestica]|uniref:Transcription factor grauzone n=1 Tax=Musca domestica TaxID=7370 RepID=A0A1I8N0T5_MUSDO|nr:transcription factor grauzone [Musca domestica]